MPLFAYTDQKAQMASVDEQKDFEFAFSTLCSSGHGVNEGCGVCDGGYCDGVYMCGDGVTSTSALLVQLGETGDDKPWILDSGVSCHMTPFAKDLISIRPLRKSVTVANGVKVFPRASALPKPQYKFKARNTS